MLSDATLRAIVNMLSADEGTAAVAMAKLRDAARERRMLVSELISSVSGSAAPAPRTQPEAPPTFLDVDDGIGVAVGKRINFATYGLQAAVRYETDKAWLVKSPLGGPDVWLPKSQVEPHGVDQAGRTIWVMPLWLARKRFRLMTPGQQFLGQIREAAANARRLWPSGVSDEYEHRRAFKAALFFADLLTRGYGRQWALHWLAQPIGQWSKEAIQALGDRPREPMFDISEREIRRAVTVHADQRCQDEVLKGAVSLTTAEHIMVLRPGRHIGAARIAWLAMSDEERRQFRREIEDV
jgi:hypothetical protein